MQLACNVLIKLLTKQERPAETVTKKGTKENMMKFKSMIAASVLATSMLLLGTGNSYALNQTIDLSSGNAYFDGLGPLLVGGVDIVTFNNLAIGIYDFDFSLSSQFTNITSVLVNGQSAASVGFGNFKFFGLSNVSTSPFQVQIFGTATGASLYSGQLAVTAVPEPATSLLMFLGLGIVMFAARQRKNA